MKARLSKEVADYVQKELKEIGANAGLDIIQPIMNITLERRGFFWLIGSNAIIRTALIALSSTILAMLFIISLFLTAWWWHSYDIPSISKQHAIEYARSANYEFAE